ncbi:hypothetical protein [Pedobacter sp.]|uniref:hypothetical protein n=1 Tax=Pedobacter sp. TaxID=1411316 RepID=UPI0031D044A0
MKRLLLAIMAVLLGYSAFAQKSLVLQALKKYNVSEEVLNPNLKDNLEKYAHEVQRTVTVNDKDKVYISTFDPNKQDPPQWTLVSVNGKNPSKGEQKAFDKEHNLKTNFKVDDNSYKVTKDDGNTLEITYQYDPTTIDGDHGFFKDCLFTLHINAKTGRLKKMTEVNLKDLRIKILKAIKLTTEVTYQYIEKDKTYVPVNDRVEVVIKMLGNEMPMITTDKYTLKP